jgi:hypothetical protein
MKNHPVRKKILLCLLGLVMLFAGAGAAQKSVELMLFGKQAVGTIASDEVGGYNINVTTATGASITVTANCYRSCSVRRTQGDFIRYSYVPHTSYAVEGGRFGGITHELFNMIFYLFLIVAGGVIIVFQLRKGKPSTKAGPKPATKA